MTAIPARSPASPSGCCASRPPPTAPCPRARSPPPRSPASTRCTASVAPRPSPPWPTAPRPSARSTSSSAPATSTWPLAKREVAGPVGIDSASPVRRRWWSSPTAARRLDCAAVDLLAQAEHGPGGAGRGWSRGIADVADAVDAAVDDLLADAPRARRDRRRRSRPAAASSWSTAPEQAIDGRQRDRARAPRAAHRRSRRRSCRWCATPARCSCGPWAPAALGDYVAGRQPRAADRRAGPLRRARSRVDDFRKHVHVVDARPRPALAALAPHVRGARRRRGARRARRSVDVRASSAPRDRPIGRPVIRQSAARRPPRARGLPLAAARRLRPAQHQREPVPAAARVRRRAGSTSSRRRRCTATPTAPPRDLRDALGRPPRATGRAGVLRQRLQRGAADAAAHLRRARAGAPRCSSPPTRCTRHIARITGTEVVVGERARRLLASTPTSPARSSRSSAPTIVFVCSPNNPTGTVEPRGHGRGAPRGRGDRARRRRRGVRRVRAVVARSSWSTTTAPLVVTRTYSKVWSMARSGSASRSAPPWVVDELDKVVLPYHLDVATQIAGRLALDLVAEMDDRVAAPDRGARAARRRARRPRRRRRVPVGRQLPAVPSRAATATSVWERWSTRASWSATSPAGPARGLPPGHGRHARGERRLPRRARARSLRESGRA